MSEATQPAGSDAAPAGLWRGVLRSALLLQCLGLVLAVASMVWFNRVTMLLLFAVGIPALLLGILLYLAFVIRTMASKGAL